MAAGTSSWSNCTRFASISMLSWVTPVRLPPGWLRLATRPNYRINPHPKDDRNCLACCFRGKNCRRVDRGDHGHLATNQLGSQGGQLVIVSLGPSIFDRHIPAFVITGSTEAATECLHKVCCCAGRRGIHVANHRHSRPLRASSERPCGSRSGNDFDEIAPPQPLECRLQRRDYSRDLRPAKWGSGVSLHGSNPDA